MNNQKPTYQVIDPVGSIKNWYHKANQYWNVTFSFIQKAESTYDGVLSGFGSLSEIDIHGSEIFLKELKASMPQLTLGSVLDCGAGIGRISK
jgi:protein N-terminal methyltransferase